MTTFKGMDLQWPSETSIRPIQILFWKLVGVNIWNSKRIPTPKKSSPRKQTFYHTPPWFEILHQYRCYFAHSLDWTFRTIITRKLLQNYAPVNTLVGYKLTFWWLQGVGDTITSRFTSHGLGLSEPQMFVTHKFFVTHKLTKISAFCDSQRSD